MGLDGKQLLITGGTGSFGRKMVATLCKTCAPRRLVVFSRDELKQSEMAQEFPHSRYPFMRYFLGDVRDRERLNRAFSDIDVVIHAAALKQVPAAEYNPTEAIHTNIGGAENVIGAAIQCGVKKVIALSTDKAANPINLYGATKLCSDKLFVAGNAYSGGKSAIFSVVRYGNVLGSRGSVVPLFLSQSLQGTLTLTDPRMTRFWIIIQDSVNFVLRCLDLMRGGEIFVPKIPSFPIVDLARAIDPNAKVRYVGIRPGEKLHEVIIPKEEARRAYEFENHYVVTPSFDWQGVEKQVQEAGGKVCEEEFEYRSDTNPYRPGIEEIRAILERAYGHKFPIWRAAE